MTTAAVDNNGDLQPDDLDGNGFGDPYPGYDPALSGESRTAAGCNCGNNGTPAIPADDCVGTDGILGTGDDSLVPAAAWSTRRPTFHDDAPRGAPLAPLTPSDRSGPGPRAGRHRTAPRTTRAATRNVALWGGVILNGHAPTNTAGADTAAVDDAGDDLVEGLTVPGFPEALGGLRRHPAARQLRGSSGTSRSATPATRSACRTS